MISIHCTHCRQLLEMDDAFAGGVCRCQYCGTIQTVPSKSKPRSSSSGKSSSSSKSGSTKALYKKSGSAAGESGAPADSKVGTGLDELAEVVASSGLARGSLRKPPPKARNGSADAGAAAAPARPAKGKSRSKRPVLVAAGAGLAVVLVVAIYFATRPPGTQTAQTNGSGRVAPPPTTSEATEPPAAGPSLAGVPLDGTGGIVFALDRSHANEGYVDAVKAATFRAVLSLGEGGRFQIIFWHHADGGIVAYPEDGLAPATQEEVDKAKRRFEDVVGYGTTEFKPTFEKAAASGADTIVLATAKGFSLEEDSAAAVVDMLRGRPVKVHALSLGESESPVLKQIAEQTGGRYREVSRQELRSTNP